MDKSEKTQTREIENAYRGIRKQRSQYNFESLIDMGVFSCLRKRKFNINLGYSNFQLLSKSDADSKSLETRLENNRPRYVKQVKLLLESGEIDVAAKGVTLRYSKKENAIALAISRDDGLSFDELPCLPLPRGKRKASEAILLMMVQTEVELWP